MRYWYSLHKWSSLICALIMLMLCITGLPLIFHDELEDALDSRPHLTARPSLYRNLDTLVAAATAGYPAYQPRWVIINNEKPEVSVGLASPDNGENPWITLNAYTGKVITSSETKSPEKTALTWISRLHADLFAGLPGQLFLGFMGLLFLLALVSGVIIYKPFTRFTAFGAIRTVGSPRQKFADLHKLLGIVALVWTVLVTGTGVLHTLSAPLYQHWQTSSMQSLLEPYRHQPPPNRLSPVQQAVATVRAELPGHRVAFLYFPNDQWGSPYHYMIYTTGATSYTTHWYTPALVDAATGQLTAVAAVPWYIRLLQLAHPLHSGNYGGLPLKVLWALLDIVTIGVIVSGSYLWLLRKRPASPLISQQMLTVSELSAAKAPQPQSSWQIWKLPLLLGSLTVLGCVAALFGAGIWQGLSWLFLSLPLLIAIKLCLRSGQNH
ncbi:PepSY-associated TM helix domain-containing protein [Sporomusa termitida]|uniref:PepSY-associated TM region n=1 Tax=Sporomusa termitida TaxID=2377 RepID=A0A517E0G2_9FIRM|nr:PepSY-associated TM helix domain-containing protein [Sporomusa termitida]QDR82986.1 PepSY-associated TM region [Sporomusa termitida]